MDADHDGLVTLQEFTQFLKHFMGDELVDAVGDKVHELFGELDQDHDGKLTLQGLLFKSLKLGLLGLEKPKIFFLSCQIFEKYFPIFKKISKNCKFFE